MTKVKICGNTNSDDAKAAVDLGADYLGFIFTESKRKISIAQAIRIMESLPHFKAFVGVFYNEPKASVERIAEELALPYLQFHGDETALYCHHFMNKNYQVIKTFHIKDAMSLKRIDEYDVSNFLFDTYDKAQAGGTGITFDWSVVNDRPFIREKLFLAGGLNISNLESAIQQVKPYAVDVASGVETEPGKKDYSLLEKFIQIAKKGRGTDARKGTFHT